MEWLLAGHPAGFRKRTNGHSGSTSSPAAEKSGGNCVLHPSIKHVAEILVHTLEMTNTIGQNKCLDISNIVLSTRLRRKSNAARLNWSQPQPKWFVSLSGDGIRRPSRFASNTLGPTTPRGCWRRLSVPLMLLIDGLSPRQAPFLSQILF